MAIPLTELQKLKEYLKPYYQDECDEPLLTAMLEDKQYAECAAAFLWGVKAGQLSQEADGIASQADGSESVSFEDSQKRLKTAQNMSNWYASECAKLTGSNTSALLRVTRPDIINIPPDQIDEGPVG